MISKNKRAQVPETLNWFFVFVVIFFVMAIFIAITVTISASKTITLSDDKKTIEGFDLEPLSSQETLFAYLNTPQGDNRTMRDVLFSYYDLFFKYGVTDLSKIGIFNPGPELQKAIQDSNVTSNQIFSRSQKILNLSCSDYLLVLPQGVISPTANDFFTKDNLDNENWKEKFIASWGNWASINLTYRGSMFEIKYRQLKEC